MRGCPYSCSYCYYPKAFKGLRGFGLARLRNEFAWALDQGVQEINILDPSFARRPDLPDLLGDLQGRGLKINCELNAEDLDAALVAALVAAGLSQVEIGLQTTNPAVLRHIRRPFNPDKFMRGVRLLRASGVTVMTDVMLGLPGDSLADVKRTLDFVVANELYDSLGVYPLAVLPGTSLRAEADQLGLDYDGAPPYLLNSSPLMGPAEVQAAFAYAAELTATDYQPVIAPWRLARAGAYTALVEFGPGDWATVAPGGVGQSLTVVISAPDWSARLATIASRLRPIVTANPFTLLALVIAEDCWQGAALAELRSLLGAQVQLFLRLSVADAWAYVLVDDATELWCGLPPEAGDADEDAVLRRARLRLGAGVRLVFHDLEEQRAF